MSTDSLHPAIERNNLAIDYMEQRDFGSAIILVNESIWMLKQDGSDHNLLPMVASLQHDEETAVSASHEHVCSHVETWSSSPSSSPSTSHHKERHRRQDMSIALEDSVSIFQCPLRIHPDTLIEDDTFTEICAILTYNCALAHHLHGVELEDDQRRNLLLKQALDLYQKAHGIHLRQESAEDTDVSFTLAILNNVGQLQGLLGNTQASARLFHRMLRILMVVVSRTEECTAETDLFFANCSRFVLDKPAAPAA